MTDIQLGGKPGKPGHVASIINGRLFIQPCGEKDCETCNPTESGDSEPVHDGTLAWWAECFPQWRGGTADE